MGQNDEILNFVGGVSKEVSSKGVHDPWYFSNFLEVSEQYDQVVRKPEFWLETTNNDLKLKELKRLIW